jgi:hypothetical protein
MRRALLTVAVPLGGGASCGASAGPGEGCLAGANWTGCAGAGVASEGAGGKLGEDVLAGAN